MKNKKGISAIVATVLIILITVAAVTIIWAAIIPMIQDQIGGSTECFDASAALSVTTDFSCVSYYENNICIDFDSTESYCNSSAISSVCENATCGGAFKWNQTGEVSVQVHRSTGNFKLAGVDIVVGAAGNTNATTYMSVENDPASEGVPDANGDKVYTYQYWGEKVSEAGVAAIVETGNTEKTCDKSGMVQIPNCA